MTLWKSRKDSETRVFNENCNVLKLSVIENKLNQMTHDDDVTQNNIDNITSEIGIKYLFIRSLYT